MSLTDMLVSAILKKGIMGEGRNIDTNITLEGMTINIKCEHITVRVEKSSKEDAE